MKRLFALALVLALLCGCGASGKSNKVSSTVFAMDTVMTLTAYGEAAGGALEAAESRIHQLEALLSISREGSDVYNLNHDREAVVSEACGGLLTKAGEITENTGGAFDVTVYPLMELWGFPSGEHRVPEQDEITGALSHVGQNPEVSELDGHGRCSVKLPGETKVDLGGIAKGFTSEKVLEELAEAGVETAVVSLGGNVGLMGKKPDGSDWIVAIEKPDGSGENIASLSIPGGGNTFVVTSGAYQRNFEEDGKLYHHIIDPKTGFPAETDLLSVTIISGNGTEADGLSTALFVMGQEKAVEFWRAGVYDFEMVLITEEGVFATPGVTVTAKETVTRLEAEG